MKKVISIFMSFLIVISAFSFSVLNVDASSKIAYYDTTHKGMIIFSVNAYLTKDSKKKSISSVVNKSNKKKLKRGTIVTILGKNSSYFYISKSINSKKYYGYVKTAFVSSQNSYEFEENKSEKVKNLYTKKSENYKYYLYKSLPIYQYDQMKTGKIKGLKINSSCGPSSFATVISALMGRVVTLEEVMYNMPAKAITKEGKGTNITTLVSSMSSYFEDTYNYKYSYKKISQSSVFDYLKDGYMIIIPLKDTKDKLFTSYSHYITLVGYDAVGNIMTVNTNNKTQLLEGFSKSRIKKYFSSDSFYTGNIVAFKAFNIDDSFKKYENAVTSYLCYDSRVYEHCTFGNFDELGENTEVKILGEKNDCFYIEYLLDGVAKHGFVLKDEVEDYYYPQIEEDTIAYNGKNQFPQVTVANSNGEELVFGEAYNLIYPEKAAAVGEYEIKIVYSNDIENVDLYPTSIKYKIICKTPSISSIKSGKSKLNVKWKKVSAASGYEIEYSRFSDFKMSKKVTKSSSSTTLKTTFSKTKYYVRIRSYIKLNGKKVYSAWSSAKTASTK